MYDVIVSPEADADLDRIVRYIAVELGNPPAATALAEKIDKRLCDLETMPAKFPLCKDSVLQRLGYHRVSAGNYLIIYRIDEDAKRVFVVHYYHTLQDYERDLLHFTGQYSNHSPTQRR